ncbi:MAG: flagellar biosynthesis protein FlhB [Candidatus Methylomirabilota bacterium]|nr:flagellar biosynthesis protein FlhB [candidate division NC10 bacterium]PWB43971.1 MAG: flagellar biosynthesis protein FlhB [candidate division NC10 bacterium]
MPPDDGKERTEAATGKRRQEARARGQVARSQEINSALLLLSGTLIFYLLSDTLVANLVEFMRHHLGRDLGGELTVPRVHQAMRSTSLLMAAMLAPFMGALVVVACAANVAQVGFMANSTALSLKWERLNPTAGFGRLFGPGRMLAELVKSSLKFLLVGFIVYRTLNGHLSEIPLLLDMTPMQTLTWLGRICFQLALRVSLVFLALAAMDYGWQRWQFEKSIRMTREEVKEEAKQTEGDPVIKGRIKSLQRQAAMQRMMADVPKADVVVVNPIHFAVAMRYDATSMEAPTVVAKGARLVAERIVETARAHGVPIVEDPPLARALHKYVAIGRQIPIHLYKAVAEILAYVYRMSGTRKRA